MTRHHVGRTAATRHGELPMHGSRVLHGVRARTGHITARLVKACHKACPDRVKSSDEHDWYRRSGGFGRERSG